MPAFISGNKVLTPDSQKNDQLDTLSNYPRGAFVDSNADGIPDTVTTASRSQGWDFNALGNLDSQTTDGTPQTRTHNKQNQITSIGSQTTPVYDNNGNMTADQTGKTLVFDAWNRLVAVKQGVTTLVSYALDALKRRVTENPGTLRDLYYSSSWQVLEERVSGNAQIQYVWSPVYVDAKIDRDRDADGNTANGLEERLYVQEDANWNVTAVISTAGAVLERYIEDPYGVVTILAADWSTRGSSSFVWVFLHQAGRLENSSGLYSFRNREYSPPLGRWTQRDPIESSGGDANHYSFLRNRPQSWTDPFGLTPKLSYETVCDLTPGDCGAFAWIIKWKLDSNTDESRKAWVVQRVKVKSWIPWPVGFWVTGRDYFEAWPVVLGTRVIGQTDYVSKEAADNFDQVDGITGARKLARKPYHDANFRHIIGLRTQGKFNKELEAYLFDGLGDLPNRRLWVVNNPDTDAGSLLSVSASVYPNAFDDLRKNSAGQFDPVKRKIESSWDCSRSKVKTDVRK